MAAARAPYLSHYRFVRVIAGGFSQREGIKNRAIDTLAESLYQIHSLSLSHSFSVLYSFQTTRTSKCIPNQMQMFRSRENLSKHVITVPRDSHTCHCYCTKSRSRVARAHVPLVSEQYPSANGFSFSHTQFLHLISVSFRRSGSALLVNTARRGQFTSFACSCRLS